MHPSQALVDRPDEIRRVINFKRLALTDLKIDIPRLAKKKVLKEALETSGALRVHSTQTPAHGIVSLLRCQPKLTYPDTLSEPHAPLHKM